MFTGDYERVQRELPNHRNIMFLIGIIQVQKIEHLKIWKASLFSISKMSMKLFGNHRSRLNLKFTNSREVLKNLHHLEYQILNKTLDKELMKLVHPHLQTI